MRFSLVDGGVQGSQMKHIWDLWSLTGFTCPVSMLTPLALAADAMVTSRTLFFYGYFDLYLKTYESDRLHRTCIALPSWAQEDYMKNILTLVMSSRSEVMSVETKKRILMDIVVFRHFSKSWAQTHSAQSWVQCRLWDHDTVLIFGNWKQK